jgi:hypothetical protein
VSTALKHINGLVFVTGESLAALAVKGLGIEASPGFTIGTFCKPKKHRQMGILVPLDIIRDWRHAGRLGSERAGLNGH